MKEFYVIGYFEDKGYDGHIIDAKNEESARKKFYNIHTDVLCYSTIYALPKDVAQGFVLAVTGKEVEDED